MTETPEDRPRISGRPGSRPADFDPVKALSLGRLGSVADPLAEEMRLNRRVNGRIAASRSSDVSFATGRPQDPMFYWKQNNLPYDTDKPGEIEKVREFCRVLYRTHPVVASAIDVYSKYPLTGMELNCFAAETEVITRAGMRQIGDLVGTTVDLLTTGGRWVQAPVKAFGTQPLVALTVRRNGREKVIHSTAGHRWFVQRTEGPGRGRVGERNTQARLTWEQVQEIRATYAEGGVTQSLLASQYGISQPMVGQIVRGLAWAESGRTLTTMERTAHQVEVTTSDLAPGDRLVSTWARSAVQHTNPSPFGVAHGVTWGDGSLTTSGGGSFVDLFGAKDAAMLRFFQGCTVYDFGPQDGRSVASIRVTNLPAFFKSLPDAGESVSYLYGFLAGWFAADGTITADGRQAYLDSVSAEAMRFARDVCQSLGIKTYAQYTISGPKTLPDGRVLSEHEAYRLPLDVDSLTEAFFCIDEHRRRWTSRAERVRHEDWTVVSVEPTGRVEEVYCAVVPGTEAFVLEDNILTGNCKDPALTDFYTTLFFEQLDYEEHLNDVGREHWMVGEAWSLGSFNETLGVWEDDELIKPEDVDVIKSPFLKEPRLQMRLPESIRKIIEDRSPKWEFEQLIAAYPELVNFARTTEARMPVSNTLLKQIKFKGDTFNPRGVPILMRGFRAVAQEEMLNAAQDAIASRMYTPLILAKLGASATDLGTTTPWIPTPDDLMSFEESLDAALSGDFRVLTHHFAVEMSSVFGRENMPQLNPDFDRLTDRILQVFGLSRSMLTGAEAGKTYASDSINRDLVSQLLTSYQRKIKRFFRDRALVVAEAQEHYDYEVRNGRRYPIMEEVLEVDPESGKQRIIEQPKLLVPDLHIKAMTMKDETDQRQFFEALRASGVPISMKSRLINVPLDLDEERERVRQEQVDLAVEAQETRKQTYETLRDRGLPIPEDLIKDFRPTASDGTGDAPVGAPNVPLPSVATDPVNDVALLPTVEEIAAEQSAAGAQQAPSNVIALPRNQVMQEGRTRPPESDEERATMPKPASLVRNDPETGQRFVDVYITSEASKDDPEPQGKWEREDITTPTRLLDGPRHVGMRRRAVMRDAHGALLPLPDEREA